MMEKLKKWFISALAVMLTITSVVVANTNDVSAATSIDLQWPCESAYKVTCMYYYATLQSNGTYRHSTSYGYDKAMDIAGGGNVRAAAKGKVITATYSTTSGFGNYVVIQHENGAKTLYAHLASYNVKEKDEVQQGQVIGVMGNTSATNKNMGIHLHFEYSAGDPWKLFFQNKYASQVSFESNVRSNNAKHNSDPSIVNFIDQYYQKGSDGYYHYKGGYNTHIHNYSSVGNDSAHPHKVYKKCSCGDVMYTGETKKMDGCSSCNTSVNGKFNAVIGFKAYPCVSQNFDVYDSSLTNKNGTVYTTDRCTINEIYANGWARIHYPLDKGGERESYTPISNFIKNPNNNLVAYQATKYIDMYSTSSLKTKIHTIYPNDHCYTIGTSGSATQIFMPLTGKGYYLLGWVETSDLTGGNPNPTPTPTPNKGNMFVEFMPIKAYPVAEHNFPVFDHDLATQRGTIYTTDYCTINYAENGWCQVTYPKGSSGAKATWLSPVQNFFHDPNAAIVERKANRQITAYTKKDLATSPNWYISAGDTFYTLGSVGGAVQVLYPIDAAYGGGYKLAWIRTSDVPSNTFTVSFNANGGTGAPGNQTKTLNQNLTLSSQQPTRTGHTFVGWATNPNASSAEYAPGSVYSHNANVTLYAVWRKQSYTISYHANGGVNAPSSQVQTYNNAITVTGQKPSKYYTVTLNADGGSVNPSSTTLACTFKHWTSNADGSGVNVFSGGQFQPNQNITLYAQYSNPTMGNLPTPTKAGYTFVGWYTQSGELVSYNTTVSGNVTLTAKWKVNEYVVNYDVMGGTPQLNPQTKVNNVNLVLSSVTPVKEGYIFKGWATDHNIHQVAYLPGATYSNNESVILYAVWEKEPVVLTSIQMETLPSKTTYELNEALDLSGLSLKLTYSDESTKIITEGYEVNGNTGQAGKHTVTIAYEGKTTSFEITVLEPKNPGTLKIENQEVEVGDTFEVSVLLTENPGIIGLRVEVGYDINNFELVKVEKADFDDVDFGPTNHQPFSLSWCDALNGDNTEMGSLAVLTFKVKENASLGNSSITLSYDEEDIFDENYKNVTFQTIAGDILIKEKTVVLERIEIHSLPEKTTLQLGEELSLNGMSLKGYYSDGSSQVIYHGFRVSSYHPNRPGEQELTVTYENLTTTFKVVVLDEVTLESIEMATPLKTTYVQGEDFTFEGFTLKANYSDGSSRILEDGFTYSGYDKNVLGKQEVKIHYEHLSISVEVEVVEKMVSSISIYQPASKTTFRVGEEFSSEGLMILVMYNDGKSTVFAEGFTCTGYDLSQAGSQEVTVTFENCSTTYPIEVVGVEVETDANIKVESTMGIVGQQVSIDVLLENNPGLMSASLKIEFDTSVLTLVEVKDHELLNGAVHSDDLRSPYYLSWVDDMATSDNMQNGVLVTLIFDIKEDAPLGLTNVKVSYDYENMDIVDVDLKPVHFNTISGNIDIKDVLVGDVNEDGKVNNLDRVVLTRTLAHWKGYDLENICKEAADVNQDGKINNLDRVILTRYLAHWKGYDHLPY